MECYDRKHSIYISETPVPLDITRYMVNYPFKLLSRPTNAGRNHSLVVVGVDTHVVILEVKGELAELDVLQFILVEVWPAPEPSVDHMGEPFPPSYLDRERRENGI